MIKIDRVGIITKGEDKGCQIKLGKATDNKGGYFIFMCSDFSDPTQNIGDHYVDSYQDLEEEFEEQDWNIKWI